MDANDTTTSWITKGEMFRHPKSAKPHSFLMNTLEISPFEWNLHVDSTPGPHCYDMILGQNVIETAKSETSYFTRVGQ